MLLLPQPATFSRILALAFLCTTGHAIALPAAQLGELVGTITKNLLLSGPPPAEIQTKTTSPECVTTNNGTYQCCESSIKGDMPIIVAAAKAVGYKLNPNDINGLLCTPNDGTCQNINMCCQVDLLKPLLMLYCHYM